MNDTMTVASLLTLFLALCTILVAVAVTVGVVGFLYRQFIDRYTIHPGGDR